MGDVTQRFGEFADEYDRYRPTYPELFWARLDPWVNSLPAGARLIDVAAGTGRAAIEAARRWPSADVVAVEPDSRMLSTACASASRRGVTITAVCAAAEALPFGASFADGITVAQAFHWFEPQVALREFHRVLRPGGRLMVFWNQRRNADSNLLREYEALIDRSIGGRRPSKKVRAFGDELADAGGFNGLVEERTRWDLEATVDHFVGFARTPSYIRSALDAPQLAEFCETLRSIASRHAEERDGEAWLSIPYETVGFTAVRSDEEMRL